MTGPSDAVAGCAAGLGCLSAFVIFVVGLVSGAGFFGSLIIAFVVLVVAGYFVSLVS